MIATAPAAVETSATSTTVTAAPAAMLGKRRIGRPNQGERSHNRQKSLQNDGYAHFSPLPCKQLTAAGAASRNFLVLL